MSFSIKYYPKVILQQEHIITKNNIDLLASPLAKKILLYIYDVDLETWFTPPSTPY